MPSTPACAETYVYKKGHLHGSPQFNSPRNAVRKIKDQGLVGKYLNLKTL